jgi:hypothetical protein
MNGTYAQSAHLINDVRRDGIGSSNGLGIMMRVLRRAPKIDVVTGTGSSEIPPVMQTPVRLVTSAPRPLYGSVALTMVTR